MSRLSVATRRILRGIGGVVPFVRSAVESAINALEVHGLDRCPDHGVDGFKRYVALAVEARNIQRIGAILTQQQQQREKRKVKYSDRECTFKLAA